MLLGFGEGGGWGGGSGGGLTGLPGQQRDHSTMCHTSSGHSLNKKSECDFKLCTGTAIPSRTSAFAFEGEGELVGGLAFGTANRSTDAQ